MARNRYGWEKRTKEIARKQKSEAKMKRRQNRATSEENTEEPTVEEPTVQEEHASEE